MKFADLEPQVVLGVAAHPDDLDFMAAGTMARFAGQGASVYYLVLTDGSAGSDDRSMPRHELVKLRHEEQRAAGIELGVRDVFFGDSRDGMLENTMAVKEQVVRIIRQVKPDIVVSVDPSVLYMPESGMINHPDHRAAGQAALDAVFPLARDHLSFPHLLQDGLEPHKTSTILLSNQRDPNFAIDVSNFLDQKFAAINRHVSQVPDPAAVTKRFTQRAAIIGKQFGYDYAEAFLRIDIRD